MSKTYYVYSTLAAPMIYAFWEKTPGGMQAITKKINIAGGANVAGKNLITPRGVVTQISEEDAKLLVTNKVFKKHQERGFMRIEESKQDPETVVTAGMEARDNSAPLVPEDFAKDSAKPQTKE